MTLFNDAKNTFTTCVFIEIKSCLHNIFICYLYIATIGNLIRSHTNLIRELYLYCLIMFTNKIMYFHQITIIIIFTKAKITQMNNKK